MPRLAGIRLHPIKSLDPVCVREARIGPAGGLELDRVWALYSIDGRWVNGKRTPAIHSIRAAFASGLASVKLSVPGDSRKIPAREFPFPGGNEAAAEWFSVYFEQQIIVRYGREGLPDDTVASGPTIISTASLQAVCDLFPGVSLESARQRFRTTLEIDTAPLENNAAPQDGGAATSSSSSREDNAKSGPFGGRLRTRSSRNAQDSADGASTRAHLPAFWEDRLFAAEETSTVRFRIGEVHFEGSNPCARCPVPSRDPLTGEVNPEFTRAFTQMRRTSLPAWTPETRFDHYYRLATNTRVASSEAGKLLRVGDYLVFD